MHLDTGFCNVSSAATKWIGTTQNMSLRHKIVDYAYSLRKTQVLDVKYVVRNQWDIVEQRNGVKIPKI